MKNTQDVGVKRINFEIPSELHRKLKAKFSSEGRSFKGVLLPFMEACLEGDGIPLVIRENGSPVAELTPSDKRINELLEAKLSSMGGKVKDNIPPLEEHTVEPVVSPGRSVDGKAVDEKLALVEESVVAERAVEAENGLIAMGKKVAFGEKVEVQRRIVGKMILLAEQARRNFFDWFIDGGVYTVVTAEERDAELAEREKDRLAEEKEIEDAEEKEIEDGEES